MAKRYRVTIVAEFEVHDEQALTDSVQLFIRDQLNELDEFPTEMSVDGALRIALAEPLLSLQMYPPAGTRHITSGFSDVQRVD
ncbi:hypothetical protein AB0I35_23095 [Nocardia sp. NPDC050378]|uniref:hypothetical protein n=1 Tax=Nocardia sp. NPDC050378 TaxID=3155400 RepID=UPI0033C87F6F